MFMNSLNITIFIENQRIIWLIYPLFPLFIIFFISTIAETNRPPFDLVEAESELVAGFFTEYSASPFVFFFLAEYSNIILMCSLTSILFLGGFLYYPTFNILLSLLSQYSLFYFLFEGFLYSSSLAIKLIILMFSFIWIRASFPRFTFDNLIHFCWLILLPLLFAFIIFCPIILYIFNSLPF
jgi:NADH-ubiquinone oxidoreductase chain 1